VLFAASDITERKKLEDDLMRLTGRLVHVQDEERRRIARELHDETAQNLFGISMNLAKLRQHSEGLDRQQIQIVEDSKTLTDLSMRGVRTLSYLLHPPLLDQAGLVAAVQWYVEGFVKRSDIPVELFVDDIGRLDSELETALFRIVQEGLTNIHRHSGGSNASIRLQSNDGHVVLVIRDDGHGIASTSTRSPDGIDTLGVGIPGMRQRLLQLGGTLDVVSSDEGTIVTAMVPAQHAPDR
jgi:signal transduction histidine kinase